MPPAKQRRFCVVNPDGGPLVLRLQATSAFRAGADFQLRLAGKPVVETWKQAAGDSGASDHDITLGPKEVDQHVLAWEILVCAMVPAIDQGIVEVQVMQDGANCAMTKLAQWQLEKVPGCATNKQDSIKGNLVFLIHP